MADSKEQVVALLARFGGPNTASSDCPSWYQLDSYRCHALRELESRRVQKHLAQCSACRARLDEEQAVYNASGLQSALVASAGQRAARSKRMRRTSVAATLAAAALALLMLRPGSDGTPSGPRIQRKGPERIHLQAFREHHGKVEPMAGGAVVSPGDRVRFEVGAAASREIMIVGVEENGRLFAYYPLDKQARSARHDGGLVLLEGAAELDTSRGRESVVLIVCQRPFELAALQSGVPPDCQTEGFTIHKASQ